MQLTMSFKLKWWVNPLMSILKVVNRFSGYEPNLNRLGGLIMNHGVYKFIDGKRF